MPQFQLAIAARSASLDLDLVGKVLVGEIHVHLPVL